MKKVLLVPILGLGLMSGAASAAELNESFNVNVSINSSCTLYNVLDHTLNVSSGDTGATKSSHFQVHCSDLLPYTLEVDTQAGGYHNVTDANTGRVYQVQFTTTDGFDAPIGTIANGEQISNLGNGHPQNVSYNLGFNSYLEYGRPEVGTYVGVYNVTLTYF